MFATASERTLGTFATQPNDSPVFLVDRAPEQRLEAFRSESGRESVPKSRRGRYSEALAGENSVWLQLVVRKYSARRSSTT